MTTSTSTVSASPSVNGTSKSNLDPGTLAGLVIGGLLAGVVLGGCIWFSIIVARRRMRRRRTVVGTQPEERLMHLGMINHLSPSVLFIYQLLIIVTEKMRGQAAPPLRDGIAIQSLPPSRNIRVLNWIARTRGAGPPSVSQHTMSERSVHGEEYRGMSAAPPAEDVLSDSSSESQSHYSHPSTLPHASTKSGPRRSSSAVGRPNVSDTRTSFIRMD